MGSRENYENEFGDTPITKLVRQVVGLDRGAVNAAFSEFLSDERLNATQIKFVRLIIDYVAANGYLEKQVLQQDPFRTLGSVSELFEDNIQDVREILYKIGGYQVTMNNKINKEINESVKSASFEKSRHIMDFHLAGFTYYDGLEVIDELTLGKPVELVAEADNPHDPEAVAIYFQERKIGYVPREKNVLLRTFLYFGYKHIFEARIQYANKETHPERQFRIVVKIKDNRDKV